MKKKRSFKISIYAPRGNLIWSWKQSTKLTKRDRIGLDYKYPRSLIKEVEVPAE